MQTFEWIIVLLLGAALLSALARRIGAPYPTRWSPSRSRGRRPTERPSPHRDPILLCAFAVVLGTLLIQGLTMKPLIRRIRLRDDDPVRREIRLGRRTGSG